MSNEENGDSADANASDESADDAPLVIIENVETCEVKEYKLKCVDGACEETVLESSENVAGLDNDLGTQLNINDTNVEVVNHKGTCPPVLKPATDNFGCSLIETETSCSILNTNSTDEIITEKENKSISRNDKRIDQPHSDRDSIGATRRAPMRVDHTGSLRHGMPPGPVTQRMADADSEEFGRLRRLINMLALSMPAEYHYPQNSVGTPHTVAAERYRHMFSNPVLSGNLSSDNRFRNTTPRHVQRNASYPNDVAEHKRVCDSSNACTETMKLPMSIYIDENEDDGEHNNKIRADTSARSGDKRVSHEQTQPCDRHHTGSGRISYRASNTQNWNYTAASAFEVLNAQTRSACDNIYKSNQSQLPFPFTRTIPDIFGSTFTNRNDSLRRPDALMRGVSGSCPQNFAGYRKRSDAFGKQNRGVLPFYEVNRQNTLPNDFYLNKAFGMNVSDTFRDYQTGTMRKKTSSIPRHFENTNPRVLPALTGRHDYENMIERSSNRSFNSLLCDENTGYGNFSAINFANLKIDDSTTTADECRTSLDQGSSEHSSSGQLYNYVILNDTSTVPLSVRGNVPDKTGKASGTHDSNKKELTCTKTAFSDESGNNDENSSFKHPVADAEDDCVGNVKIDIKRAAKMEQQHGIAHFGSKPEIIGVNELLPTTAITSFDKTEDTINNNESQPEETYISTIHKLCDEDVNEVYKNTEDCQPPALGEKYVFGDLTITLARSESSSPTASLPGDETEIENDNGDRGPPVLVYVTDVHDMTADSNEETETYVHLSKCIESGMTSRVKERRTYLDQELDDDDIEGKRLYKIEDKIVSKQYNKDFVREIKGEEFNLKYLQEDGLQSPIIFKEKSGLGLRVPSDNFKVSDVKACVGSRRMLDVMDVNTQKGMEMTMKEWVRYYENLDRDRLLNVISLEFSHTKLENYVESPNLVREVDWVDTAWPQHLKDCQTESTNAIDKMKYPKVQKYCLMSVAGCYTDFHIDFGGTSVWYHILHGEKIFWLIPPTPSNLACYEHWVLSGKQGDAFLADTMNDCQRIHLVAGNTFIIPSGWIHAVYTPKDSLVFGGNFLHSFNMVTQLRVSAIEDKTHVPMKFRYPFYTEINWYVLERYVHSLTGVTYLEKPQLNEDMEVINVKNEKELSSPDLLEEKLNKRLAVSLTRIDLSPRRKSTSDDDSTASGPPRSPGQASAQIRSNRKSSSESSNSADMKISEKPDKPKVPYKSPVKKKTKYVHLTKYELEGLIELVGWVENLPPSKKGVPKDLIDPDTVIAEIKRLIQEHMKDNPELAITGEPVLEWTKATKKLIKLKQKVKTAKLLGTLSAHKVKGAGKNASGSRHRRVRCKKCEPCTRDDCMECNFCKDMKKYGGPGRAKQSCISRQCLAPMLPNNVSCQICKLDKSLKDHPVMDDDDFSASLMECGICWEIIHPLCLAKKYENLNNEGVINEDLPNSWKCSKCCYDGKEGQLKTRVFKGGWRPNPSGTPPPQIEISIEGNQSPMRDNIITEGKRVTLTQTMDSKPSPKPSVSPSSPYTSVHDVMKLEPVKMEVEPVKLESEIKSNTKPVKMESESAQSVYQSKSPGKTKVKMELREPSVSYGMNGKTPKSEKLEQKRRQSPEEEPSGKKRRLHTQSLAKSSSLKSSPGKSTKLSKTSSPSRSSGKAKDSQYSGGGMKRSPELTTKRTKREGAMGVASSHTSTMYDFDDSEMMDVSTPLLEKGKGRGFKGCKFTPLKETNPGLQSNINTNKTLGLVDGRGTPTKKHNVCDKTGGDNLKKTLLEHIERRNLKVVTQKFVVRPAPVSLPEDFLIVKNGAKHPLTRKLWTKIFSYLPSADIARCLSVCRVWNRWCINPELWKKIDLSRKRVIQTHLMGIVRRQPEYLNLSSVIMTQKQVMWLVERLPLLKTLIVSKCSWATISGLCMSACPLLHTLDVGWASGLNDQCFEDLITPPVDRKPAVRNISRLHRLRSLDLSGTEITDESLNLITVHLSRLQELNISYCTRITDKGIQSLASSKAATQETLEIFNVSGCRQLSEASLQAIKNFKNLSDLNVLHCKRIPGELCREFRMNTLNRYKW